MKIAILGYDTEGRASYDYFVSKGDDVTICDQNPKLNIPKAAKAVLGDGYLANLDRFELLVRTAGMQPGKILARNPSVGPKITSHINEFFKVSPTRNIVGITGTKGKGTTSTLIAKMLEADGKPVKLGGNIGIPPLSFLADLTSKTWVILELSSFQLIDLQASPHMAVCLMVAPEHLDWHGDNNEYVTAKTQLFRYQKSDDFAIYYAVNKTSKRIATTGAAKAIPYATPPGAFIDKNDIRIDDHFICHTDELKLLGKHNLQNVCASITAVWQVTKNVGAIRQVLTSFRGLPFRLEFRVKKQI